MGGLFLNKSEVKLWLLFCYVSQGSLSTLDSCVPNIRPIRLLNLATLPLIIRYSRVSTSFANLVTDWRNLSGLENKIKKKKLKKITSSKWLEILLGSPSDYTSFCFHSAPVTSSFINWLLLIGWFMCFPFSFSLCFCYTNMCIVFISSSLIVLSTGEKSKIQARMPSKIIFCNFWR